MDTSIPLNPSNLFSANGLIVVITGGGSGMACPVPAFTN
jgi:hypothetical protein